MYTYRKKRIIRNILLVTSILAVGAFLIPTVLANIPSTHEIIGSIEDKISNKPQVNVDTSSDKPTTNIPQQSTQMDEKSPYGSKQTQYWMEQLRQQPQFMDCTDQQLIHYFNLESQSYQLSYVHAPPVIFFSNADEEMKYAQSHPDAYRYMTYMQNGGSLQDEHWVSEKQNEYNSLSSQIQNYHC